MSNYPIWWDTTVTIYNKFVDSQTQIVRWYRTVLTNCFWSLDGTKAKIGDVVLDTKSVICRIPENSAFLDKKDWLLVPNDKMANYFTIGQDDIIIKGEVEDVIDEYTAGQRSTDLLAKYRAYQECMEIEQYTNNTGVGRNNPHYLVRGQ